MKKTYYIFGMLAAVTLLAACTPSDSGTDISADIEAVPTPSEIALEVRPKGAPSGEKKEVNKVELAEPVEAMAAANTSGYKVGAVQTFDQAKFDEALANGDSVLLDFHASWCNICRSNEPIIKSAVTGSDVVGFQVDYDTAQALRSKYGVVSQSTLIVFEDGKESKRAMGAQSSETLADLL